MAEAFAVLKRERKCEGDRTEKETERKRERERKRRGRECWNCCCCCERYGGGVSKNLSEAPWHARLKMETAL